jgi:glyoxylase-like metal-dependent hydrolase (beta-lactamase superfamily II)
LPYFANNEYLIKSKNKGQIMFTKLLGALALITHISSTAQTMVDEQITVQPVAGDVYMLQGPGGNIGILATDKGLLLVDDKFLPLAKKIENAMKSIENKPLKYVINTHYHGDHTGSNAFFAQKAPIFAHENVRNRLSMGTDNSDNLPVVTYQDGIKIFLGNEEVTLSHLPAGHTDGDTFVYFKKANVLHTGDLFFEVGFPYIDLKSGGSVKGYLASVRAMLKSTPDDVIVIPGHGKITDKQHLKDFATMIEFSISRVSAAITKGKSDEEIIAAGIGDQYKSLSWAFITEEKWLKTLITDLR